MLVDSRISAHGTISNPRKALPIVVQTTCLPHCQGRYQLDIGLPKNGRFELFEPPKKAHILLRKMHFFYGGCFFGQHHQCNRLRISEVVAPQSRAWWGWPTCKGMLQLVRTICWTVEPLQIERKKRWRIMKFPTKCWWSAPSPFEMRLLSPSRCRMVKGSGPISTMDCQSLTCTCQPLGKPQNDQ